MATTRYRIQSLMMKYIEGIDGDNDDSEILYFVTCEIYEFNKSVVCRNV